MKLFILLYFHDICTITNRHGSYLHLSYKDSLQNFYVSFTSSKENEYMKKFCIDQKLKIITIGCQGRKRLQARADIYLPERKEVFVRHLSF